MNSLISWFEDSDENMNSKELNSDADSPRTLKKTISTCLFLLNFACKRIVWSLDPLCSRVIGQHSDLSFQVSA